MQAVDWPTRRRNYRRPDSATVRNGCDVARVAHRLCRQHKWLSNHQHRLSFSRAEIILLSSWIPVQQIVYHMLRFFVKADERLASINEDSGSKTHSNYHVKTLMLWACELETRTSWMIDVNAVRICVKLLHTLSLWLSHKRCPHYFANNCNLLNSAFSLKEIADRLMSANKSWLSAWFINNYIRKCVQCCPSHLSRLFNDIGSTRKLRLAVSGVVNWRLDSVTCDLCRVFSQPCGR